MIRWRKTELRDERQQVLASAHRDQVLSCALLLMSMAPGRPPSRSSAEMLARMVLLEIVREELVPTVALQRTREGSMKTDTAMTQSRHRTTKAVWWRLTEHPGHAAFSAANERTQNNA